MRLPQNWIFLGDSSSCHPAVDAARRYFTRANGCYWCCRSCHTSQPVSGQQPSPEPASIADACPVPVGFTESSPEARRPRTGFAMTHTRWRWLEAAVLVALTPLNGAGQMLACASCPEGAVRLSPAPELLPFTPGVISVGHGGIGLIPVEDRRSLHFYRHDGTFNRLVVGADSALFEADSTAVVFGRLTGLHATDSVLHVFDETLKRHLQFDWDGNLVRVADLVAAPMWPSSQAVEGEVVIVGAIRTPEHFGYQVHWFDAEGEHLSTLERDGVIPDVGTMYPLALGVISGRRVILSSASGDRLEVWADGDSAPESTFELPVDAMGGGALDVIQVVPEAGEVWVAVNWPPSRPSGEVMILGDQLGTGAVFILELQSGVHLRTLRFRNPVIHISSTGQIVTVVGGFGAGGALIQQERSTSLSQRR